MDDLISRQAAIDALFELYEYQRDIAPTEAADLVRQGIFLAEKKIEKLPSAQPEPQWIPWNSGNLPEESGTYAVTAYDGAIKRGIWMKAGEYDEEIVCSLCGRESHDRYDELDEFEGHAVIALKTPRYCGALMRRHT